MVTILEDWNVESYHVVEFGNEWVMHAEGDNKAVMTATTKAELLEQLPEFMKGRVGSVKIHTATGLIEEERTYPRSADPRESRG